MAKVSFAKKSSQSKKESEEGLSRAQKVILIASTAFVPFFLFILLPLLTRHHLVTTLKIPAEVLLSKPLVLHMAPTGDHIPKFRLNMHGLGIQIPHNFTPVLIRPRMITFRNNPRRISRTISVSIIPKVPGLDLSKSGMIALFMPEDLHEFLETILWATWHPVRLYCKGQFLVSQGITGSFFHTIWDVHHSGFVFPTPGNTGYLARIFADDKSHYIEFAMFDETDPVKLDQWSDVAITLSPPPSSSIATSTITHTSLGQAPLSLAANISLAASEESAPTVLQDCLNEYFRTGSPSWLIPVGIVMEERGFYRETIALCKQIIPLMNENSQEKNLVQDLFERSVKKILKIDVDPNQVLEQFNIYIKNLSKFPVKRIRMTIVCAYSNAEQQFSTVIQDIGWLQAEDEKVYQVKAPVGYLSTKLQGLSWKVDDVDIGE